MKAKTHFSAFSLFEPPQADTHLIITCRLHFAGLEPGATHLAHSTEVVKLSEDAEKHEEIEDERR